MSANKRRVCSSHAHKWDGTRVVSIKDGAITLQNRNGILYTIRLPEVVKALQAFLGNWIVDGEAVFINPETGKEEFTACQRRCSTQYPDPYLREQFPLKYEIFDILQVGGTNLEHRSYLDRKRILREMFEDEDGLIQEPNTSLPESARNVVEFVPYEEDLLKAWNDVITHDREGLIVKQVDSAYEHERSYKWLKAKNWRFELCSVVGFSPGKRARTPFFGALVLERDGKFRGCAGSGFNEWELRKFKDLFSDAPRIPKPYSDDQVGEAYTAARLKNVQVLVKYYQITDGQVMRFPIFVTSI